MHKLQIIKLPCKACQEQERPLKNVKAKPCDITGKRQEHAAKHMDKAAGEKQDRADTRQEHAALAYRLILLRHINFQ